MTELSRNLLNAAREGLAPDAEVAARVRARVAAAVGAGAIATPAAVKATPPGASAPLATPVATNTAGIGLAAKLGAALLVVGLAAVALVATRDATPPQAPALSPAAAEHDEPTASRASSASHEHAVPMPETPTATPPHEVATAAPSDVAKAVPNDVAKAAPHASLAREVELIDQAMLALRTQSPADALAAIAIFDKETRGRGQMAEDAAAIALEAHCRLGHDVSGKLAAFDASYPSSAQRSRIRDTCKR